MKKYVLLWIWINSTPPLIFIRPLTNKLSRAWSSMINLWIDFLLSARCRSSNHFEPSKANVLGSHWTWTCFTWKFFMIWFYKILRLIFQTQPSCSRNICAEHWKKVPDLIAFSEIYLYLKSNDSVEHVQKVLLIVLFIYFKGKIKFSLSIWSIWSIILLSKMKLLFSSLWTKIWQILHVTLENTNIFKYFSSNFASFFSAIKYNSSVLFQLKHYTLWLKRAH